MLHKHFDGARGVRSGNRGPKPSFEHCSNMPPLEHPGGEVVASARKLGAALRPRSRPRVG